MINLNFTSDSPLLPAVEIKLHNHQLSPQMVAKLIEIVLVEEPRILATTLGVEDERDPSWITARLWGYNFLSFDYPEVDELKYIIAEQYNDYMESMSLQKEPVYIQCWINILRNDGRTIYAHNHADAHGKASATYSYMSGNIAVRTENTSTSFASPFLRNEQYVEIGNKDGEMILFPSFLYHWTSENKSEVPRITISFDIITEKVYNMINCDNFIKL